MLIKNLKSKSIYQTVLKLSWNSSNMKIFNKIKEEYEEGLNKVEHKFKLNFRKVEPHKRARERKISNRKGNIIWFNSLF